MRVLALDLATRTGWAKWDGERRESGFVDFTPKRGESPGMRYVRFNAWLDMMIPDGRNYGANGIWKKPDLVVYEQAWGGMKSGAAAEVALGLATRVQELCAKRGVDHTTVNGSTLKKWTTGNGHAGKPRMVSAVNERFGPPFVTDDNESDAIALLEYAKAEILPQEGK